MSWELFIALVAVASGICAILFGARNNRRAGDAQVRNDALSLARIEGKLDSAVRGIEDMRVEVRGHGNQIADLNTRVARCEESMKIAHKRLDGMEKGE